MKKPVGKNKYKIIAGAFTIAILIVLLLTGPAEAFIMGLSILNGEVDKGGVISFTASVNIEANENLEIDKLVLRLNGPKDVKCEFNTDGSIITGCLGIMIQQIETAPYNFGYGFGEGNLTYNITLNTTEYFSGKYKTQIEIIVGQDRYIESGEDIMIKSKVVDKLEGCSIRADGGELTAEGSEFGSGKINFHIPLGNANNGKGSLSGQKNRDRFSYKFDIIEILENNPDYARILVKGKYKIVKEEKRDKEAVIYFDKIKKTISVSCANMGISDNFPSELSINSTATFCKVVLAGTIPFSFFHLSAIVNNKEAELFLISSENGIP